MKTQEWLSKAAREAQKGVLGGHGGPFGAVIVKDGTLLASAHNEVIKRNDPTAHAEVLAIRKAAKRLGSFDLSGCELYTTCEPCPMCMGAVLWARIGRVVFGVDRQDAASIGFDDSAFYRFFESKSKKNWLTVEQVDSPVCKEVMTLWQTSPKKIAY